MLAELLTHGKIQDTYKHQELRSTIIRYSKPTVIHFSWIWA